MCVSVCTYHLFDLFSCQPVPGVMNITSVKKKTSLGALCSESSYTTAVAEPLASSFITTSPDSGTPIAGVPWTAWREVTCDCYALADWLTGCTVNVTSTGNSHIVTCDNNVAKTIPCGGDLIGKIHYGESKQYKHKLCTSQAYKPGRYNKSRWTCLDPSLPVPQTSFCPGNAMTGESPVLIAQPRQKNRPPLINLMSMAAPWTG